MDKTQEPVRWSLGKVTCPYLPHQPEVIPQDHSAEKELSEVSSDLHSCHSCFIHEEHKTLFKKVSLVPVHINM